MEGPEDDGGEGNLGWAEKNTKRAESNLAPPWLGGLQQEKRESVKERVNDYSSDLAAGVNCQSVFVSWPLQKNLKSLKCIWSKIEISFFLFNQIWLQNTKTSKIMRYHGSYSYWKDSIACIMYLLHIYLANYFFHLCQIWVAVSFLICSNMSIFWSPSYFHRLWWTLPFFIALCQLPKINSLWLNFKYQFTPFFFFSGPPFFN